MTLAGKTLVWSSEEATHKVPVPFEKFTTRTGPQLLLLLVSTLFHLQGALAQSSSSASYSVNSPIPDNDASGLSSTVMFASPQISSIETMNVTLNITGGFNGDLYAYLTHGSGSAVLLNRV